jgi:hypothetical protein
MAHIDGEIYPYNIFCAKNLEGLNVKLNIATISRKKLDKIIAKLERNFK